jgi:poly(3-hydroxyalkanoate) synthetase
MKNDEKEKRSWHPEWNSWRSRVASGRKLPKPLKTKSRHPTGVADGEKHVRYETPICFTTNLNIIH